jgi:hypothetical protein
MKKLPPPVYRLIEWGILLLMLAFFYLRAIGQVPPHGDESQWIATSYFFEAALDPQFVAPDWATQSHLTTNNLDEALQAQFPDWVKAGLGDLHYPNEPWDTYYWTLTQPMMVRYVIATARLLHGYHVADLNTPWDFEASQAQNIARGNWPSYELLVAVRQMMALLSVASGVILFLLVRQGWGTVAGWCFACLYAFSGYLTLHLRRAMGDASLLFFTCLAMLCGWLALIAWEKKQRLFWPLFWLALMGVAAGLAGGAKLNGLGIALAGVAVAWLMAISKQHAEPLRKRLAVALGGSLLVVGLCAGTFVLVNPYLYPNPIARTAAMFTLRTWEMGRNQQNPQWGMPTLDKRIETVSKRVLEDYTIFRFGIINILLGGFGLFLLLRSIWQWVLGKDGATASPILLFAGCVTVIPALTTPLDWDRYYLFPVVFLSVLIAIGLGKGLTLIGQRLQKELD